MNARKEGNFVEASQTELDNRRGNSLLMGNMNGIIDKENKGIEKCLGRNYKC